MKPRSNVKTPPQCIASLPADRAKTIATVRALVNKHNPRRFDECLVWRHDRLDDPPVSISRYLQQAADLLRRALVAEELLLVEMSKRIKNDCFAIHLKTKEIVARAQAGQIIRDDNKSTTDWRD